jgi:hypothetical protein
MLLEQLSQRSNGNCNSSSIEAISNYGSGFVFRSKDSGLSLKIQPLGEDRC